MGQAQGTLQKVASASEHVDRDLNTDVNRRLGLAVHHQAITDHDGEDCPIAEIKNAAELIHRHSVSGGEINPEAERDNAAEGGRGRGQVQVHCGVDGRHRAMSQSQQEDLPRLPTAPAKDLILQPCPQEHPRLDQPSKPRRLHLLRHHSRLASLRASSSAALSSALSSSARASSSGFSSRPLGLHME